MDAHDDRTETSWQQLASLYLGRLANGEDVEIAEFEDRLTDPDERVRFVATALAEEYLWRLSNGESVLIDDFLSRLSDAEERELFAIAIDDARHAGQHLPLHVGPGTTLFERFRVLEVLGSGGMATVYEAEDLELQRRVALKVVRASTGTSSVDRDNILEESRILARLDCPNITRVFDVLRDGDRRYIAMDLVRGVDLKQALARVRRRQERTGSGPLGSWLSDAIDLDTDESRADRIVPDDWYATAAGIVRALAAAVELAHANGIVHRDLKPGNVMLTARGDPVLLDFGLAGRTDAGEVEEGFHGTPSYVAPEQIETWKSGRDPRTDVYQIGLLLYELLTLKLAYPQGENETLEALFFRISQGELRDPSSEAPKAPSALCAICRKALATDPDERYQDLGEMGVDLERFEAGLPPAVARIPLRHALRMRARYAARRPATFALAATLAALALGALQVVASLQWSGPEFLPFSLAAGASQPTVLDATSTIAAEDSLCLRIDGADPSQLYVLVQLGGASPEQRYVRPTRPLLLEAQGPAVDRAVPHDSWAVAVAAGSHPVVCAKEAPRALRAGLLAFACAEREETLERWMNSLDDWLIVNETAPGVPFETALALLEEQHLDARGGEIELTTEEWQRTYGAFIETASRGEIEWGLDDFGQMVRFDFFCDVRLEGTF